MKNKEEIVAMIVIYEKEECDSGAKEWIPEPVSPKGLPAGQYSISLGVSVQLFAFDIHLILTP
jgi:hypothetical protein